MRPPLCFCVYKNTKIQSRESALPFFSFPLLLHLVIHTPMSQTAFYYVPFHHLGCPISPFGISHFTIWDVPFDHLGYPILPFGMSHFTIWGIPFRHLGYPILPFGLSHFAIWDVPFRHLGCPKPPFGMSHFTFWDVPFYLLGCPISPFGVYFRHICAQCTAPIFCLSSSFSLQKFVCFFPFGSSCFS